MPKFTIVKRCIGCMSCTRMAEDNFKMSGKTAEVFKQPETDYELEECIQAMQACPIRAIETSVVA